MLNTSIARDGRLAALSIAAEYLYLKTIPHLDRDGLVWGEPETLWGIVCPRRPELLPRIAELLAEWLAVDSAGYEAPLVILYDTPEGHALAFPSFAKNQINMRYEREPASIIQPPPGYVRTPAGLVPQDSGELPATFRQPSGNLPADGWPEVEVEVKEEGGPAGAPAQPSLTAGYRLSARLRQLNAIVGIELRQPLVEVLLDITGKRPLVDVAAGASKALLENADRLRDDAHEQAAALYKMGYTSETQLLDLEPAWARDWRGRNGGGTFAQFVEFASEQKGLPARNGRRAASAAQLVGPAIPETFPGTEVR